MWKLRRKKKDRKQLDVAIPFHMDDFDVPIPSYEGGKPLDLGEHGTITTEELREADPWHDPSKYRDYTK